MTTGPIRSAPKRLRITFWAIVWLGSASFFVFSRSWQDGWHMLYDLSAAPVVFAFIGVVVLTGFADGANPAWWSWAWLLLPLTIVPVGAHFLQWPISGHLTDLLIAASGLSLRRCFARLSLAAIWLPVLPVLYIRWQVFDIGGHWRTYNAILVAGGCIALASAAMLFTKRPRPVKGGESR